MKVYQNTETSRIREKTGLSVPDFAKAVGRSERTIYRWEKGESNPDKELLLKIMKKHDILEDSIFKTSADFRFVDLFAGIGGLRKAFESVGGTCVFTCEWDAACRKTYLENFGCDHPFIGDIRDVDHDNVPNFNLLLAGFPCQPFSIAGVSKKKSLGRPHGFHCDTQGTLFFDVAQMIEHHRPEAFLLENVKNLVSHDKGRTFKVIIRTLVEELGYHVSYKVIDARHWVPQHRERIFIVGFREKNGFSMDDVVIPDANPTLSSILHPEDGSEVPEPPYTEGSEANVAAKYTLSDKLWSYLQQYAAKHKAKGNGFGFGLATPDDVARTLSARYYKDGSEILIHQEGKNPRRLTPRECARLMGFDQPGADKFKIPVADTPSYKQFGNSVAVPVVEAIAFAMLPHIKNMVRQKENSRHLEAVLKKAVSNG